MKHLSLFSGIGGLDLAAEMAGFTTVGQAERDDYCNGVLDYHWPEVPRWRDVKDVTAESFEERTGIKPGTLALLSGGFPCQPVSCAGKRKGDTDERWLWDEMLRVICEVRPRWVVAENVRGLLSIDTGRTYGRILADLAENGYCVGWLCYGAGDVGAPHKRERVFIVAHTEQPGTGYNNRTTYHEGRGTCQAGGEGLRPGNGQACTGGAETAGKNVENPGGGGFGEPDICSKQQGGAEIIGASEGSQLLAYTPRLLLNRAGETGTAGWGELADGGMADTEKPGLEKPTRQSRGAEENPRPERGNADTGQENGTRQGPAQPGLGGMFDGLSDGMAGNRWPAGWWPTPNARDHMGPRRKLTDGQNVSKKGVRWGMDLNQAIQWPAGPGEQHEWEPPRIATGVKDRVNKLKALGNAVVPA